MTILRGEVIRTLGDVAHGRDNNFNVLRVAAALAVLISHCWPIALGPTTLEPLQALTGYKLGTTAVLIFFAVSGFFITKSFDRRISLGDFFVARVARLYPGLIVATLVTTLIIGPFFSSLELSRYLCSRGTWTYVLHAISLVHIQWTLPGVFTANKYPDAVNGSLWTLFVEVECYATVAVAGLLGALRPRLFPGFALLFVVGQVLFRWHDFPAERHAFALLSLPFFLGAACYVYRFRVPLSGPLALALALLAFATSASPVFNLTYPIAVTYASLWFGMTDIPVARKYNRVGDYSYGIYVYAFPIQQTIVAFLGSVSPLGLMALSMPASIALAFLSWTFVERPSLNHRHVLFSKLRRVRVAV